MKIELGNTFRGFIKKKNIIISLAVIIILAISSILFYNFKIKAASDKEVSIPTTKVTKGDISVIVSGAGPMVSSNREEITTKVEATVKKVYFKEGDSVKAGDLIMEFDDSDEKVNLEKIKTNLALKQLTQKTNLENLDNLNMKAPFSGQVSDIKVKVGDKVSSNGEVMTITDNSQLKVILPFSSSAVNNARIGTEVTVHIQDLMQSVTGKIKYISGKGYSTSVGGELYNVEIVIDNPGSLKEGMVASGEISSLSGNQFSVETGALEYVNNLVYKSTTGGTVKKINVIENQYVNSGEILLVLENNDLVVTVESGNISLLDYENEIASTMENLENYKIYSPIDGTIVSQDVAVGDTIKSSTIVTTVANNEKMEFDIDVDELDIEKVAVGQRVSITIDAITSTLENPLEGIVSNIAIEGTSSSGVTTYPVTVSVDNSAGILGGMNANAEIYVTDKKDVLLLPIEAIIKVNNKSFVLVKDSSGTNSRNNNDGSNESKNSLNTDNANANSQKRSANSSNQIITSGRAQNQSMGNLQGVIRKEVQVGVSNATSIEIITGLNEGDEVVLQTTSNTNNANTNSEKKNNVETVRVGGMGGFGGPAAAGGGPR